MFRYIESDKLEKIDIEEKIDNSIIGKLKRTLAKYILQFLLIIYSTWMYLRPKIEYAKHKVFNIQINSASNIKQVKILQQTGQQMGKAVPQHICLAVTDAVDVNFDEMVKLTVWCHAIGVQYISLYDITGQMVKSSKIVAEKLKNKLFESRLSKDSIQFIQRGQKVNKSDLHDGASAVRTIDIYDGKTKTTEVIADLLNEALTAKKSSKEVTDISYNLQQIEERIRLAGENFPDPELVLLFGQLDTVMGLLPWQLNHSELIRVASHDSILPSMFLQSVQRYTKIQKRFGK